MPQLDESLTQDQLDQIIRRQQSKFKEVRAIPIEGIIIQHMGKDLQISPAILPILRKNFSSLFDAQHKFLLEKQVASHLLDATLPNEDYTDW